MASVYRQICMPKAELLLSNESIYHLTEDLEVTGVRAIMLTRAACHRHAHVETELIEHVENLRN